MLRKPLAYCIPVLLGISLVAGANTPPSSPTLSAADIVDKNVAARGGLQAWRAVQTMSMEGKLGAGGNQRSTLPVPNQIAGQSMMPHRPADETRLPFVMDLKRQRKMRLELQFNGQTSLQVFDGSNGWKLRPFLNRRVVEPYTQEEMKVASRQADLDGPLVDYAAKGTRVEFVGTERVGDRDNYKLKLTLKNGDTMHVWVDAETFLETKMEGQPRRLDGTEHPVEIYFQDYRQVSGLKIPFVLETKVLRVGKTTLGVRDTPVPAESIVIEKVVINPKLEDSLFAKPDVAVAQPKAK
jgi:hypothetical protein